MKKLSAFVNDFSLNSRDIIKEARKAENSNDNIDPEKVAGKPADKNGTEGVWAIDEPTDDTAMDAIDLNSPDNSESLEDLIDKFDAEEDFFILGEAGWGKTSIIESLAHKYKRRVITVYLDKCEATDLAGMPIPMQGKTGAVTTNAMPGWAKILEDNPKDKFLLFFDEMNQADPAVMNALMPIVLKHTISGRKFNNFFVGAAGNFDYENQGGVSELSGPLKSRFKPLIVWEKNWKQAYKFLHKKYDGVLGKNLVDLFEENADIFENPREVDMKIFTFMVNIKKNGDLERNKASKYLRRLNGLTREGELSRDQKNTLANMAEQIANYISGKDDPGTDEGFGRRKKDKDMISSEDKEYIKLAMTKGYLKDGDTKIKYGISRENIMSIMPENINAEIAQKLIKNLELSGVKFKFEKDEEWKKRGYHDPQED